MSRGVGSSAPGGSGVMPALARMRRLAVRRVRRAVYARSRSRERPPFISRDWVSGPPDFVGVGVQRAATSWWFSLIEDHPQVHSLGAAAKELHYFDRFWHTDFGPAEVAGYHDKFFRPPGLLCGEWTPRYMFDSWTPALLHRAAPDARILVMLRDPVDRLRSGLTHALERGGRMTADTVDNAVNRGLYYTQLMGLLAHYPRDQVLILQSERCRAEPEAMLRRTQEFLGLDEHSPRSGFTRMVNSTTIDAVTLTDEFLADVARRYEPDGRALVAEFPEIDPALWPSFAPYRPTS